MAKIKKRKSKASRKRGRRAYKRLGARMSMVKSTAHRTAISVRKAINATLPQALRAQTRKVMGRCLWDVRRPGRSASAQTVTASAIVRKIGGNLSPETTRVPARAAAKAEWDKEIAAQNRFKKTLTKKKIDAEKRRILKEIEGSPSSNTKGYAKSLTSKRLAAAAKERLILRDVDRRSARRSRKARG